VAGGSDMTMEEDRNEWSGRRGKDQRLERKREREREEQ